MDPLTLIVTALVSGAAAALKPTAEQAVKDAYAGLKEVILRKWSSVNLDVVESNPASQKRQEVLKEDLEKAQAAKDLDVLERAKHVVEAVRRHDPKAAAEVGVTLRDLEAAGSVRIRDVAAQGGSVTVETVRARGGDVEITGVKSANPPQRQ
jgi:hypothetical protein